MKKFTLSDELHTYYLDLASLDQKLWHALDMWGDLQLTSYNEAELVGWKLIKRFKTEAEASSAYDEAYWKDFTKEAIDENNYAALEEDSDIPF